MNAKPETKQESLVPQEGQLIEDPKNAGIIVTDKGLDYADFIGLWRLSNMILKSKMQPKGMDSAEAIAVAIARGRSLGLDPFQSMESFCIINGRAMLYGNTPLALCRQHPAWQESGFQEYFEIKGERVDHPTVFTDDSVTAVCITQRKGGMPYESRFSVADAKRAGLWGKEGKLYGTYPQRMLKHRARGYNLQDNFGDALKGISIRETFDEEVDGTRQNPAERVNRKLRESHQEPLKVNDGVDVESNRLNEARRGILSIITAYPEQVREGILKKASHDGYKWLEMSDLETCDNLEWLKATLEKLKG